MPKPKKNASQDNRLLLLTILGVILGAAVLPPTFRSCQIAERSLEPARKTTDKIPETPRKTPIALVVSPKQIMDDISSRPSLQQNAVIKNYLGNHVDWLLNYSSAKEEDKEVRVFLHTPRNFAKFEYPVIVSGKVSLSDYPWLKITYDGTKVRVRGIISDIQTSLGIDLVDMEMELEPKN